MRLAQLQKGAFRTRPATPPVVTPSVPEVDETPVLEAASASEAVAESASAPEAVEAPVVEAPVVEAPVSLDTSDVPPAPEPEAFESWSMLNTKAELTAAAEAMGIDVKAQWNKAEILDAIRQHEQ